MSAHIASLLRLVEESYNRKAWHGPNLRGSIRGVTEGDAAWRPRRGRHNIREIVIHTASWKYAVRRRLTGEKRGSFPLKGSNWFASPDPGAMRTWAEEVALLAEEHRKLRRVLARLKESDLPSRARGGRSSVATLAYGIASHDVYHAGQIQLIKRLRRS